MAIYRQLGASAMPLLPGLYSLSPRLGMQSTRDSTMPCSIAQRFLTLAVAVLTICTVPCFATETWFNQRVTWKYGKDGLEWKTIISDHLGCFEVDSSFGISSHIPQP